MPVIRCAYADDVDGRIVDDWTKILHRLGLLALHLSDHFSHWTQAAQVDVRDGGNLDVGMGGEDTIKSRRSASCADHAGSDPSVGRTFFCEPLLQGQGREGDGGRLYKVTASIFVHERIVSLRFS